MGNAKPKSYENTMKRRIKEGRGKGWGPTYKPWLYAWDVPSHGLTTRLLGLKTDRIHHLFSKLELYYYLMKEWQRHVVDIREEFPLLPREMTIALARECGIRHPMIPKTRELIVMTTDILTTEIVDGHVIYRARAIKPFKEMRKRRVLEKLYLEGLFWRAQEIEFQVVTEREICVPFARNIQFLRAYTQIDDRVSIDSARLYDIATSLASGLCGGTDGLVHVANACDKLHALPKRTSLTVAYHLLATRQWTIDMSIPLVPRQSLILQRIDLWQPGETSEGAL